MQDQAGQSERVRALNDAMRRQGPATGPAGMWVTTPGVRARPDLARVIEQVRRFEAFTADNDPHGEHDFGEVEADGAAVFWKIDYYDRTMTAASPDPGDPAATCRVLTVMLAEEY
jgi:hypothetical protein